jgi:NAD(P)-dependent dehydrogenase (short-subunit alcohol dehydrogenase family)
MMNSNQRVVLITGASSGIGLLCAQHLQRRGYRVYGTSRRPAAHQVPFNLIELDVDDDASVRRGVERIVGETGRLDGVVNNAGYSLVGAVEDTSIEEAKAQFETNFFGVLRVCQAALPVMRVQRSGHIVNISSMAGVIGVPYYSLYSASKSALEAYTDALRLEVRPFGLHAVLIQPGDFHTQAVLYRRRAKRSLDHSVYRAQCDQVARAMERDEIKSGSPERVAYLLERILASRSPRPRYRIGPWIEQLAVMAKPNLPGKVFDWFVRQFYQLP